MTDTDGNIGKEISNNTEKICGLLFDISAQTNFWNGTGDFIDNFYDSAKSTPTVVELNTLADAVSAGITPRGSEGVILQGIPYYHIKHFFDVAGGSGRLFVMFADCSNNWDALITMQKAAHGVINQFGVWTEKYLWTNMSGGTGSYAVAGLVSELNSVAVNLANDYNAPVSILVNANSAKVLGPDTTEYSYTEVSNPSGSPKAQGWYKSDGDGGYVEATETEVANETTYYTRTGTENTTIYDEVVLSRIPTCITGYRYVSVLLGQAIDNDVHSMQSALVSKTPVGNVGAALGILSIANVAESIGWVQQYDVVGQFPDIEMGFGNVAQGNLTNYDSLNKFQIDELDSKGYIFLCRYVGYEGHVFFNCDQTCSDEDYRTIARNRVINKSRRGVRLALLKYVNSPIKVDPATGLLSTTQIAIFRNLVSNVLNMMVTANEVSGIGNINIPADQNILQNDRLMISYTLVPVGTAKEIKVTEGLVLKQQ